MKVAVFSTRSYDREYFDRFNAPGQHQLAYFEASLNTTTTNLTLGFEGVCVFVNDVLDGTVVQAIAANGIRVIVLRCAGFNNVDLAAARQNHLRVFRVPSYSPHAVAEHAVALILTLNRKTTKPTTVSGKTISRWKNSRGSTLMAKPQASSVRGRSAPSFAASCWALVAR